MEGEKALVILRAPRVAIKHRDLIMATENLVSRLASLEWGCADEREPQVIE